MVALLNSLHVPDDDDQLADERAGPWLAGWLGEGGDGWGTLKSGACDDLRTVREGVRELVAAKDGRPVPSVVARATAVLRAMPMVIDLGDGPRPPRIIGAGDPGPVGRAVTAAAAVYLAVHATDEWSRVKVCAAPDCRWAFVDTSRNRSRRWCDMSDCGNRAKARTWRASKRVI
jgi:predicted RNA-binding Zn ribbon-like protein